MDSQKAYLARERLLAIEDEVAEQESLIVGCKKLNDMILHNAPNTIGAHNGIWTANDPVFHEAVTKRGELVAERRRLRRELTDSGWDY